MKEPTKKYVPPVVESLGSYVTYSMASYCGVGSTPISCGSDCRTGSGPIYQCVTGGGPTPPPMECSVGSAVLQA